MKAKEETEALFAFEGVSQQPVNFHPLTDKIGLEEEVWPIWGRRGDWAFVPSLGSSWCFLFYASLLALLEQRF